MNSLQPMMIAVAPNGARLTRSQHSGVPIWPRELANTARQCLDAGASMIHVHVRDQNQQHSLDVDRYRDALRAIRSEVGQDMVIQVTTESVGVYQLSQQIEVIQALRPESFSMAIREFFSEEDEQTAADFLEWTSKESVTPQFILYSPADVTYFMQLRQRGLIPDQFASVLLVLGRYSIDRSVQSAAELLPLLKGLNEDAQWAVCGFGALEFRSALTAAGLGGHCRLGFENNTRLLSGDTAAANIDLVQQLHSKLPMMGRRAASLSETRRILGMPV